MGVVSYQVLTRFISV